LRERILEDEWGTVRAGRDALVGGDHVVAGEVEEVVEVVVQVLLHLLAGDREEFPLDHQFVESLQRGESIIISY
jgi:hypothetical protein